MANIAITYGGVTDTDNLAEVTARGVTATQWAKGLIANHPELTTNERFVLRELADLADTNAGEAWPTVAQITEATGIQRRAVINAFRTLRRYVAHEHTPGYPIVWTLTAPAVTR